MGNKLGGEITLWGIYSVGRDTSLRLDDNSAGDTVDMLCWGIDELRWGIGRTSPRTILPWQLAEDNPVISWWGNNH